MGWINHDHNQFIPLTDACCEIVHWLTRATVLSGGCAKGQLPRTYEIYGVRGRSR